MERAAARVQCGGEPPAVSETTEGVDQGHEGPDDDVAEHHVEQQLPIRPARAVGPSPQVAGRCLPDELVEVGLSAPHLAADFDRIHLAASSVSQ